MLCPPKLIIMRIKRVKERPLRAVPLHYLNFDVICLASSLSLAISDSRT